MSTTKQPTRLAKRRTAGLALLCCAWAAGCHRAPQVSQEEEVRAALNRFYAAEPACLWDRPVTLVHAKHAGETVSVKEGAALDSAGLIDKERHGYVLTNAGQPFWRADPAQPGYGNLCFGHWHVTHVTRTTQRKDDLYGNTTETEFEATIPSPALWTRMPEVQQAFPLMTAKLTQQQPHSATMRYMDKQWKVAVIAVP